MNPWEDLVRTSVLADMPFEQAAPTWLASRRNLRATTIKTYTERIRVMNRFWGPIKLIDIEGTKLREYQDLRQKQGVGASCINHECNIIEQMLRVCGRWGDIGPDYDPLPLPKESPHRALTPQEEERLYRAGMSNPAWEVAFCCTVITVNSSCGEGELRFLRLQDVSTIEKTIRIQPEGCKVYTRERVIPLNDTAWRAMQYLLERAHKLGVREPEHYLLPYRIHRNRYDVTRPMRSWRAAFRQMCKQANLKISYYCLRHHAISKILELPISDKMAEALAGHIGRKMLERYSHVRIQAKWAVVRKLEKIAPSYAPKRKGPKSVKFTSKLVKQAK